MNHLALRMQIEEREEELTRHQWWIDHAREVNSTRQDVQLELDRWQADVTRELRHLQLLKLDIARRN